MLLKSLVAQFANAHSAWLTLAMASTLAGNLTITCSVSNIIVVERARKEAAITFFNYFRIGLPVTLLTLLFGWLWLSWSQCASRGGLGHRARMLEAAIATDSGFVKKKFKP